MSVHSTIFPLSKADISLSPGRREIKHMTQASLVAPLEIDLPADTMIPAIPINTETVEDPCVVRGADLFPMLGRTTALLHQIETTSENPWAVILEIFLPANLQEARKS